MSARFSNRPLGYERVYLPLDMKGCICHFKKWQIHPFISKGTKCFAANLTNPGFLFSVLTASCGRTCMTLFTATIIDSVSFKHVILSEYIILKYIFYHAESWIDGHDKFRYLCFFYLNT